ncbi:UNVERIFIED_CONTAM: hypothetical protein PYX00_010878 [Menopon gallinae]|uniref:PFU domain-containing protein n=1 Tax=Menopon gallinae TaxID=328185 RepID=A0AAW2H6K1_9NEOP
MLLRLEHTLDLHSEDVKDIVLRHDFRATCSRDATIKVQAGNEVHTLYPECGYVNCLALTPALGLYAGCQNGVIVFYESYSAEPVRLIGHTSNVCALDYNACLLSGSWDNTLKEWEEGAAVFTFTHPSAVWSCKYITKKSFVTACADTRVRVFENRVLKAEFIHHMHCVRSLWVQKDIYSVSNEGLLIQNSMDGKLVRYEHHSALVYSVYVDTDTVLLCGDSGTIIVNGKVCRFPVQTFWKAVVWDGRVYAAGSDGRVYVFEKQEGAEEDTESKLEATRHEDAGEEQKKARDSEEPGAEKAASGQRKKVVNGKVYTLVNNEWVLFGDVVQKFDNSFNVEVDGRVLQLSFNDNENVFDVASRFLQHHKLSEQYRDDIVEFIKKNFKKEKPYHMYRDINFAGVEGIIGKYESRTVLENLRAPSLDAGRAIEQCLQKMMCIVEERFAILDCYRYFVSRGFVFDFAFLQNFWPQNRKEALVFVRLVTNLYSKPPFNLECLRPQINHIKDTKMVGKEVLDRQYTLDQLCFYLINTDMAYTEYLKKCKANGIQQVSYIDQRKLIDEIKSYEPASAVVDFDPAERHRREHDYSFVSRYFQRRESYKIIVPSSYQSLINVENAKDFLEVGVFRKCHPSLEEGRETTVMDKYVVHQDGVEDWKDVVAVFLDGSKWQYRDWKWNSLHSMTDDVAAFFLYTRDGEEQRFASVDVMSIKVSDGAKLDDRAFRMMWTRINLKIDKKTLSIWALMCEKGQARADYNALIDKHELRFDSIPITYDKYRKPSEFPTYENQRNRRLGNVAQYEPAELQSEACSTHSYDNEHTNSPKEASSGPGHVPEYRPRHLGKQCVLEMKENSRWNTPLHAAHCHDRGGASCTRNLHEPKREGCRHPYLQKHEGASGQYHRAHIWYLEPVYFDSKENHFSRQRLLYKHEGDFEIYVEDILLGVDRRTTCMIKNIPNKYSLKMLIELLDEEHRGTYNFVYLRMDFKNKCNVGYAFVNFASCMSIVSFYRKVHGKSWKRFTSNKICELTYASIQGFSKLVNKFRNSSVMQEKDSFRPKIFYTRGPQKGLERKLL